MVHERGRPVSGCPPEGRNPPSRSRSSTHLETLDNVAECVTYFTIKWSPGPCAEKMVLARICAGQASSCRAPVSGLISPSGSDTSTGLSHRSSKTLVRSATDRTPGRNISWKSFTIRSRHFPSRFVAFLRLWGRYDIELGHLPWRNTGFRADTIHEKVALCLS